MNLGWSQARLLPLSASSFAAQDNRLMLYMLGVAFFFAVLVFALMIFFSIRYRHRAANPIAYEVKVSYPLEILWSAVPFAILIVGFAWGAHGFLDRTTPPGRSETIFVLGKQWMWEFEHENGRSEINQLHVPVSQNVNLLMISQDVIHSFFIPDFRVKYDLLPSRYTHVWFRADTPGRYAILCSQYCGANHPEMVGEVIAMTATDYQAWLTAPKVEASISTASQRGHSLFVSRGCISCHGSPPLGHNIGPDLKGLYHKGDEALLRSDILNPSARIAVGYTDVMPTFAGRLKEQELFELVSYLTSNSAEQPND